MGGSGFLIGATSCRSLQPGGSIEIEMTLYPGEFVGEIVRGRRWRIQEGAKLVAIGTILDLLPPAL